jgi:hypothetical protein
MMTGRRLASLDVRARDNARLGFDEGFDQFEEYAPARPLEEYVPPRQLKEYVPARSLEESVPPRSLSESAPIAMRALEQERDRLRLEVRAAQLRLDAARATANARRLQGIIDERAERVRAEIERARVEIDRLEREHAAVLEAIRDTASEEAGRILATAEGEAKAIRAAITVIEYEGRASGANPGSLEGPG